MIGCIWEDDNYFAVSFGAREALIDGDDAYQITGFLPVFVNKSNGVDELPEDVYSIIDALCKIDQMTLVVDYTNEDLSKG
jgi:hypothetical protein